MTKERAMVPKADFSSYYGRPILKRPTWRWFIPAYFFLGGLAGASGTIAGFSRVAGRPALARRARLASLTGISVGGALLVADLGRPERFLNMLRVAKPSSPMSVGTWILSAFGPAAGAAVASDLTGFAPAVGLAGDVGISVLGPLVATYTGVLIANTAVPAWSQAGKELPVLFGASGSAAAAGVSCLFAPKGMAGAPRRLAVFAAGAELAVDETMRRALGETARPYEEPGVARTLHRLAKGASVCGMASLLIGRRGPWARVGGAAIAVGSALERFAVFHAGIATTEDPAYVVRPQRERISGRAAPGGAGLPEAT